MVYVGDHFGFRMIGGGDRYFTRMLRHIANHGNCAVARDAERVSSVGHMAGKLLELAGHGIEAKFGVSLVIVDKVDAAAVRGPLRVANVAVELGGDVMGSAAVAVHQIETGNLVSLKLVVIAYIGDVLAVRRDYGRAIGASAIGQCFYRAIFQREAVDLRIGGVVLVVVVTIGGDQQKLGIGRPACSAGGDAGTAKMKVAGGD